jgi:hypothetical protein
MILVRLPESCKFLFGLARPGKQIAMLQKMRFSHLKKPIRTHGMHDARLVRWMQTHFISYTAW